MECARYDPFIVPILPTILEIQAHSLPISPKFLTEGINRHKTGFEPSTLHNKMELLHPIVKKQV